MKTCSNCGAQLKEGSSFCTTCGQPVQQDDPLNGGTTLLGDSFDAETGTTVLDEAINPIPDYLVEDPVPEDEPIFHMPNVENNIEQQPGIVQGNQPNQGNTNQYETISPNPWTDAKPQSFAEFYELVASSKTKGQIKALGIIAIITAALSLVLTFTLNPLGVIDVIFYTVMAVLLFKKRSWIIPLIMVIYSGIFTIIELAVSGTPSGIVVLIVGIMAIINMKKLDTAYKNYQSTGIMPTEQI